MLLVPGRGHTPCGKTGWEGALGLQKNILRLICPQILIRWGSGPAAQELEVRKRCSLRLKEYVSWKAETEQSLQPHHVCVSCSGLCPSAPSQPEVEGNKSCGSPGQGVKPELDTSWARQLRSLGAIHPGERDHSWERSPCLQQLTSPGQGCRYPHPRN